MTKEKVTQKAPEADPNKVIDIPVKQLLLDPQNPRLAWIEQFQFLRELNRISPL